MKGRDFINELPSRVEDGDISREEVAGIIAEDVMLHPRMYGIPEYSDDLRSELNVRLLQDNGRLLGHYKKNLCEFSTYLYSFVHYQMLTILRMWKNDFICNKTFLQGSWKEVENSLANYERDEYEYKILHFTPHDFSRREKAPYQRESGACQKQLESTRQLLKANADLTDYFKSIKSSKEKLMLVLALKSSYFINERQIKSISKYCNIPESELNDSIAEMNDSLIKKIGKLKKIESRRDKEFFLHRKYREELQNLEDSNMSADKAKHIGHLYEYHTKKWRSQNELIKQRTLKNCPSNKAIADVLGICERQVGYYIKNAERIAESLNEEVEKRRKENDL